MEGDPPLESSVFASAQFNQVVFHNLYDSYPIDSDLLCNYSIHGGIEHSEQDRIGVFEVGWQSIDDAFFLQEAPKPADLVIFKAKDLPKNEQMYQLCYLTEEDMVAGASVPFFFRSPSDNEWVTVEDPDGDFVTVHSDFAILQSTNTKLTLENQKLKEDLAKMKDELNAAEKMNTEAAQLKMTNEKLKSDPEDVLKDKVCWLSGSNQSELDDTPIGVEEELARAIKAEEEMDRAIDTVYNHLQYKNKLKDVMCFPWGSVDKTSTVLNEFKKAFKRMFEEKQRHTEEQEKIAELEKEMETLRAYISELEAAAQKSSVTWTKVAVDDEQMNHIVHVLSDELSKMELENKSLKEALRVMKSSNSNSFVDIGAENTLESTDSNVHVSSDELIEGESKKSYCDDVHVEEVSYEKSDDSQESTETVVDGSDYSSSEKNDPQHEKDEPIQDNNAETKKVVANENSAQPDVSDVEKEKCNTSVENQVMDSTRNLTETEKVLANENSAQPDVSDVEKETCNTSVENQVMDSTRFLTETEKVLANENSAQPDVSDVEKEKCNTSVENQVMDSTRNLTETEKVLANENSAQPDVSDVEKETCNTSVENQVMDSTRNLTENPVAGKSADNLEETSSDPTHSCNSFNNISKIPEAYKHCAEDYLKSSTEKVLWRKRSLISGFSHARSPLNVILSQPVVENTAFQIQVKTLADFRSFSIEFTNNHSRIVLQLKASVYPEYAFIFNSLDENWGPEERHQFLLEPNNVYDLCFVVKRRNFEFRISEPLLKQNTCITYNHRMAPSEIRYVHVSGDIIVNEASIQESENACCQEMRERLNSAFSEYVDLSYRHAVLKTGINKLFG